MKRNLYSYLHFDSRLFGYKVARLKTTENITNTLQELKKNGFRLAYAFVDPSDKEANRQAKKNHGILVDQKITYGVKNNLPENEGTPEVFLYQKKKATIELLSLALQSGVYSRFFVDTHFTHGEYKKMYTMWLKKSLNRDIAFGTVVHLDAEKKVRGFMTLAAKDGQGSIGLLAVDSEYRRQSIGKKLLCEAFRQFDQKKLNVVTVTTQKVNKEACSFYEKFGFRLLKAQYVYHFWL